MMTMAMRMFSTLRLFHSFQIQKPIPKPPVSLNVENILIAIVIIGVVGLLLEQGLMLIARRFSWQEK